MSTPGTNPPPKEQAGLPAAETADRLQFRLTHLFLATLLVAVITLIAMSCGAGSLPLSIGMTLAWLNVRGAFGRVQRKQARPRVCYAAWLLIAASLVLPSTQGCNQKPIQGWQAAHLALIAEGAALEKLSNNGFRLDLENCVFIVQFTLINLANLLVLISPLFLYRLQKGKGRLMGNTLAVAVVAIWLLPWDDPSGFYIGYYLWAGGLTLLLHTMRLGWRSFLVMAVYAPVTLAIGARL